MKTDGSPQLAIRDAGGKAIWSVPEDTQREAIRDVNGEVVFDANRYPEDKNLEAKLIAKAGRETSFSGMGLGERDLGWYFSTEAEARACADKFRDDPILRVRVYEEEHE